ncbi:MAG: thiamine pyrophosphate-dependent dehydrogenase E1 component subunit alpha [Bdellovibrionaceae bacterium]|nr:thiamine pyrophosphate-dependent dehydrogenase E1 component subunit alpha [Pseudobdellovibrionaceae bacterium]MDW8190002.1 thiamine pyrophosphate-dependent dehydrogenase E1 component subunit alpha [Pseudobdellovibrionaceae bacterium]
MSVSSVAVSRKKSSRKSVPRLRLGLSHELCRLMYQKMLYSRILEERLIKIYRAGDGYFWIGGPGEEGFGVPLGLLVRKGQGVSYDYLHLHYRCTPTLVAMGMPMIDSIRLMMNRSTDPCTGGRNFSNHYCFPQWNVLPVTSPIEVQYVMALGTAHVQKRAQSPGITIVTGGDAGTAEGDFASCLVWSSRKGQELPILITVQNNRWGISTAYEGQHGEDCIADRARAFNIKASVIDGNDPIESYRVIKEMMEYVRQKGKPAFIEAFVSRLYGHSSASGANYVTNEECPVRRFEELLLRVGVIKEQECNQWRKEYEEEGFQAQQKVRQEPVPSGESIWNHIYADQQHPDWRRF